jgi:hypothetical protein
MMRRRQLSLFATLVLGCFQILFHIEHPKEDFALIANKFLKDYPISNKKLAQEKKKKKHRLSPN